jgi:protein-S-isoprenylcysteine O-methyltransferase Ste14
LKPTLNYPPVWLVGFMALAWLIARVHAPWGGAYGVFGYILMGLGVAITVWSALAFRKSRTTIVPHQPPTALVRTGPYRFSRNPIYLADMVVLAGWCLALGSPWGLLLLVPFYFVLLRLFILPEEARLTAYLGKDYVSYRDEVRRWI